MILLGRTRSGLRETPTPIHAYDATASLSVRASMSFARAIQPFTNRRQVESACQNENRRAQIGC